MCMHHSVIHIGIQYIQRCGTAEGTISIGRRGYLLLLTTGTLVLGLRRYSSISFLSLNLMRQFRTLIITETPGIRALYSIILVLGDVRGYWGRP